MENVEIILKRPNWSINGLNYWTIGWKEEQGGKMYGEMNMVEPPRKKEIEVLKAEALQMAKIWKKYHHTESMTFTRQKEGG